MMSGIGFRYNSRFEAGTFVPNYFVIYIAKQHDHKRNTPSPFSYLDTGAFSSQ
jgi:hypothetical protein